MSERKIAVKALIVEDNPGDFELAMEWLRVSRHVEFEVARAETLKEGKAWLSKHSCDLILLDLNLPDATGADTVRDLKQAMPPCPIVVVSGAVSSPLREEAICAGADEVISKDSLGNSLFSLSVLYLVEHRRVLARESQISRILQTAPVAMVVVDMAGSVRHINEQALVFFDRRREDFVGERLTFAAPENSTAELRVPRKDGERIGEMKVVNVEWEGERAFLASIRDVTQQRQLEMQLVMSDRLVSLGTLAAGVAHEINNPLAAVMVNVDIAVQAVESNANGEPLDPSVLDGLRDVKEAAVQIRQIVRDLKVFSRGEGESRGVVDLHRTLDSVARMSWNEVRHRARLVKDYGAVRPVLANESRLSQVFLNLVMNAAHAIPVGHADHNEIRISTRMNDTGGVVISVQDTGGGIPLEVQRRLFTPFFTTKPVGTGTGLGLAICQRIVQSLDGHITFVSEPGRGSTFSVTLPAVAPEGPAVEPSASARPSVRRGRVLVVDDEAIIGRTVLRLMGAEHDVHCVEHANEGLERIARGEWFDAILCDLMMPEITGIDFCYTVEALHAAQARQIVFMTGGAFSPQAREFLEGTSYPWLEKPFEPEVLRRMVQARIDAAPTETRKPS